MSKFYPVNAWTADGLSFRLPFFFETREDASEAARKLSSTGMTTTVAILQYDNAVNIMTAWKDGARLCNDDYIIESMLSTY